MTLVDQLGDRFGVEPILRVLEVSVSTFYGWVTRRRRPSPRDIEETWLGEQIERIHKESDGTYGSPKVHAQLRREGIRTSRKRAVKLGAGWWAGVAAVGGCLLIGEELDRHLRLPLLTPAASRVVLGARTLHVCP